MPTPQKRARSHKNIRTHSGSVGPLTNPSTAYLRIAILEMEKERRGREREVTLDRMESLTARFSEIDAEKAAILDTLGRRHAARRPDAPGVAAPARPNGGGLTIKY